MFNGFRFVTGMKACVEARFLCFWTLSFYAEWVVFSLPLRVS